MASQHDLAAAAAARDDSNDAPSAVAVRGWLALSVVVMVGTLLLDVRGGHRRSVRNVLAFAVLLSPLLALQLLGARAAPDAAVHNVFNWSVFTILAVYRALEMHFAALPPRGLSAAERLRWVLGLWEPTTADDVAHAVPRWRAALELVANFVAVDLSMSLVRHVDAGAFAPCMHVMSVRGVVASGLVAFQLQFMLGALDSALCLVHYPRARRHHNVYLSYSLADFWGNRWNQNFARSFRHVGYDSVLNYAGGAARLHPSSWWFTLARLGAFAASSTFHAIPIYLGLAALRGQPRELLLLNACSDDIVDDSAIHAFAVRSALTMVLFFVVQHIIIVAWRSPPAKAIMRGWPLLPRTVLTFIFLGLTLPMFITGIHRCYARLYRRTYVGIMMGWPQALPEI